MKQSCFSFPLEIRKRSSEVFDSSLDFFNSWSSATDDMIVITLSWKDGIVLSKSFVNNILIIVIKFFEDDVIIIVNGLRNFFQNSSTRNVFMLKLSIVPSSQHLIEGQGVISEKPGPPDLSIVQNMKIHRHGVELFVSQLVLWDSREHWEFWKTWWDVIHCGSHVRQNKNNISKLNSVHSGDVDISHHNILQSAKGLKSFPEGSSLNSSLWVQRIGSHVVVFSEGLVNQGLIFAILIVVVHFIIKVLNSFGSPV